MHVFPFGLLNVLDDYFAGYAQADDAKHKQDDCKNDNHSYDQSVCLPST